MATLAEIQQLYVTYFGRPADPTGLDYWALSPQTRNLTALQVGNFFGTTPEFQALAATGVNAALTQIYVNNFGRQPEPAGLQFWAQEVNSGRLSLATAGYVIANNASAADAAILANKVTSSQGFTAEVRLSTAAINAYSGSGLAGGVTFLAGVTATPATTAQTTAAVATVVAGGGGSGQTFTLTTNIDTYIATSPYSTFNGATSEAAAGSNTYQAIDTLRGTGAGNVLNITSLDYTNNANLAVATVSGIQTLNLRAIDATATDVMNVNAANFSGLTAFNTNRSSSAVTLTNLATGATAGMIGDGSTTNGAFTFGYSTASDPATLNISGGTTAGNVAISSTPAAVTFNSTGSANTIGTINLGGSATTFTVNATTGLTAGNITAASLTTLTVSGAAATPATPGTPAANDIVSAVQFGTLPAAVTTINAAGMTAGGVAVTLVPTITSFAGGAGTDTVTTAALTSTTAGIINAGAGTGDVLRVGAVADIDTAGEANLYSGFEILDAMATNTAIDPTLFSRSTFTGLRVGGAAVFTNLDATQAANVVVYANSNANYGLTNATNPGTIDTLSLEVNDGLTANNTITLANITAAGVENININAVDNVTIGSLTNATSLNRLVFTGGRTLNVTTGALAAILNSSINASASTGTFTLDARATTANGFGVTGSATRDNTVILTNQVDAFTGGSGNDIARGLGGDDILSVGSGNDTVIGGLGADSITLAGGSNRIVLRPGDSYAYATGGTNLAQTVTIDGGTQGAGAGTATVSIVVNGITVSGTATIGADINATELAIATALATAINANEELPRYLTAAAAAAGGAGVLTITSTASAPVRIGTVTIGAFTTALGTAPTATLAVATNSTVSSGALTTDSVTGFNFGGSTAATAVDVFNLTGVTASALTVVSGGAMSGASLSVAANALLATGGALNGTTNSVGIFTYGSDSYLVGNIGASGNVGFGTASSVISDATSLENASDFIVKITGYTGTLDASDFVFG